MNKILIIGHPDSGYGRVEKLLHRCGMKEALPSRRDQLSAQEIIRSISKATKLPDVENPQVLDNFSQAQPSTVWDSLVLDLMLGNIDQELWGWADSRALLFMEYLAELDAQLAFVLVYDSPGSVLSRPVATSDDAFLEASHKTRLDHWVRYNSELLRFFLQHQNRCTLVHVNAVQETAEKYLTMLQSRLSAPLDPPGSNDVIEDSKPTQEENWITCALDNPEDDIKGVLSITGLSGEQVAHNLLAVDAENYLIEAFLDGHPESASLFEELQASATLPFESGRHQAWEAEQAWDAFLKQRWFAGQLLSRFYKNNRELSGANDLLSQLKEANESRIDSMSLELSRKSSRIQSLEAELGESTGRMALLLGELLESIKECEGVRLERDRMYAELCRLKEQSSKTSREYESLMGQLLKIQGEMEALYLENRELKQAPPQPTPPPAPVGAGDRVKQHLSYRLGSLMVQQSKSLTGVLWLPISLVRETNTFRQQRRINPPVHPAPIQEYADADQANRIRNQLSYRLGSIAVSHARNPLKWPFIPLAIAACSIRFHMEKNARK